MKKIGMCCACGGSFSLKDTVIFQDMELCRACADLVGAADETPVSTDKQKQAKRRRKSGDIYNPRDVAILGGDPSL